MAVVIGTVLAICYLIYLVRPLFTQAAVSTKRVMADKTFPLKCPGCNCTFYCLVKDGIAKPEVDECRWCGFSFHQSPHSRS